jgi:hypothetical protein
MKLMGSYNRYMSIIELLSQSSPEVKRTFLFLRDLIFNRMPEAIEEIDLKGRLAGYMLTNGYRGTVFTLILSNKHVSMGFNRGVELPDPNGLLTGSGKIHKVIRFNSDNLLNDQALKDLMDEAIKAAKKRLNLSGKENDRKNNSREITG